VLRRGGVSAPPDTSMADSPAASPSLLAALGGEQRLREVVFDFVGRMAKDVMIGFHFRGVDLARLVEHEVAFARQHLGGDAGYAGRPLDVAHRPHRILGGQFNRRLRLLAQTMEDHQVPAHVQRAWLEHSESLRALVTADGATECND
jgi:hemoglobin